MSRRLRLALGLGAAALAVLALRAPLGSLRPRTNPDWLPGNPGRDARPETGWIMEALAARPGESVADIGAGAGYFTFKLAPIVGPAGRVYATDTDGWFVRRIRLYAGRAGLANIEALEVPPDRPGLPVRVDKALIVNLFYFDDRAKARAYLARLHGALRPGGRAVLYQDESGCPRPGPGQTWGGCMLTGAELQAAAQGLFVAEKTPTLLPHQRERGGYLLLLRRVP